MDSAGSKNHESEVRIVRGRRLDGAASDGDPAPGPNAAPSSEVWGIRLGAPGDGEGLFATVVRDARTNAVVVTTDPLGLFQVYHGEYRGEVGGRPVLTDSIAAVERVGQERPDPVGIASFVALGWPLAHRTLFADWRVLGPGTTRVGAEGVVEGADPLAEIDARGERVGSGVAAAGVLESLMELARQRCASRPDTIVRLTGGQDSRVVLAICRAAGLDPECVTRGCEGDLEVEHARLVAAVAGCRHRVVFEDPTRAATDWRSLARTLLERTDGMVSLWQVADVTARDEHSASMLGGIGGEIARRYWNQEATLHPRAERGAIASAFAQRLIKNPGGLLTSDAMAGFEAALRERIESLAYGLEDLRDLPDVFYAKERVRRWGGANARKIDPGSTTFAPLATRCWYDAAMSISPEARIECRLHYEVVRQAAPRLLGVPLFKTQWPVRGPRRWLRDFRARRLRGMSRDTTIEIGRDRLRNAIVRGLRDVVLDSGRSWFFEIVDRDAFERATAADVPSARDQAAQALLASLTAWIAIEGVPPQ